MNEINLSTIEITIYLSLTFLGGGLVAWILQGLFIRKKLRFYEAQLEAERVKLEEANYQIEIFQDRVKEQEENVREVKAEATEARRQFLEFQAETSQSRDMISVLGEKIEATERRQEDLFFKLDSLKNEIEEKNSYIVSLEQQLLKRDEQLQQVEEKTAKEITRSAEAKLHAETVANKQLIEIGTLQKTIRELQDYLKKSLAANELLTNQYAKAQLQLREIGNQKSEVREDDEDLLDLGENFNSEIAENPAPESPTNDANPKEENLEIAAKTGGKTSESVADNLTKTEKSAENLADLPQNSERQTESEENLSEAKEENLSETETASENKMFPVGEIARELFSSIPQPPEDEKNQASEYTDETEKSSLNNDFDTPETAAENNEDIPRNEITSGETESKNKTEKGENQTNLETEKGDEMINLETKTAEIPKRMPNLPNRTRRNRQKRRSKL